MLTERQARSFAASSRSTSRPGSPSARRTSSSARDGRLGVDGAQRARRARAPRPAHPSAHLGRPCADRARATATTSDRLLERLEPRPPRSRSTLAAARSEIEAALQSTTDMLSQVTQLLALVSAPPLADCDRPPRRGAPAPAAGRDGRRHHVDGRGDQAAVLASTSRSTRGSPTGPASISTSSSPGCELGARQLRQRLEDPSLSRSRAIVPRLPPAGVHRAGRARRSSGSSSAALPD